DKPGVAAVELDVARGGSIPELRALRHRAERMAHALRLETDHSILADRAARCPQNAERLRAWLECHTGIAHQDERCVDEPFGLFGADRLIRSGRTMVQTDVLHALIRGSGRPRTSATPCCALHEAS